MVPATGSDSLDFARLVAEARAGSAEALGQLWQQCRNYLLLVANQKLAADLQAKVSPSDLVQETFLEAQRDLAQFHGDREEELRAWLVCILANNAFNVTRHYRATAMRAVGREVALPGADGSAGRGPELSRDTPTPSAKAIAQEELAALEGALARLPEQYRRVIQLRHDQHQSFAEVGAALGCSAEAARKLWTRAIDHLEKELNPPHGP
jgi:RNA polymerase sigma-70 factor (ECF subfamily)